MSTKFNDINDFSLNLGVSKVVLGAAATVGDYLGTDANGAAVTYVHGTDTTAYAAGIARTAGASGEIIEVELSCLPPTRMA